MVFRVQASALVSRVLVLALRVHADLGLVESDLVNIFWLVMHIYE